MAELVLSPTKVFTEGFGTSNAPYVVAPDLSSGASLVAWTDGDDTSYAKSDSGRSARGNYPLWSDADSTIDPSWVTAIGVRFRAKSSDVPYFVVQLFGQVSKLLSNPFYGSEVALSFTSTDTWEDFDYVVADADYDTTGWAPAGVQSALTQTFLYCRTVPVSDATGEFGGSGVVLISEQRIVIYYTVPDDTAYPQTGGRQGSWAALRQYPRSDGLGASPVNRAYPPAPSAQASNRRAGGYL